MIAEEAASDKKSKSEQNNAGSLPARMHAWRFCGFFLFPY
jgi:hypothetical protein